MVCPEAELAGDVAGTILERASLHGLLATVLRRPLPRETLRALRQPEILACWRDLGADPGEDFVRLPEDALLEELAVDYTQLFHGPRGHMPPYESVQCAHDGGSLNGPPAGRVRRLLDACGFCFNEECGELPDHIAVELEAMSALLRREADAWRGGDKTEALRYREDQRTFFVVHLGAWGPEFGRRIQEKAETPFYRAAGKLLAEFLEQEDAELRRPSADSVGLRDEKATQQGP